MRLPRLLTLALTTLMLSQVAFAQELELKKDLAGEWLVNGAQGLTPFTSDTEVNVVYLRLSVPHPYGEYLKISGIESFTLFVNNQLAGESRNLILDLDSLSKTYASRTLLIAVYQKDFKPETLSTQLLSRRLVPRAEASFPETRPSFFLRDFGILAALLLAVMVVVIIRLNPKLAGDYFSPVKIISLREDEAQMGTRMASSTNILFYVYSSLLLGYFFSLIFHFLPADYSISLHFRAQTFWGAMAQWIKLSAVILLFLFVKIILILSLSYLFGMAEIGGLHFLNWVRLIVVFFGVVTLAMFIYFVSHGYDANIHVLLLKLVVWATGLWIVLLFLKLASKVSASMFHLFSYICATELIPFLLIVKVLYN